MESGWEVPTFQRNRLPPSSGEKRTKFSQVIPLLFHVITFIYFPDRFIPLVAEETPAYVTVNAGCYHHKDSLHISPERPVKYAVLKITLCTLFQNV
jgi:hypothetical protein